MKAAVLYEIGKPLVVEDGIEIPALEPGQVLVKVAYSGVCHSQLMEVQGKRGEDLYLPHLLGHEGSGVVIDVGHQVSKVHRGDKVVLTWIKGQGANCAGTKYRKGHLTINAGAVTTFNDYAVVSENRCVKIPDRIAMDVASLLGCAVLTGAGIVLNTMRPTDANTIAIWGAGGIGLSALMAAKLCDCNLIAAVDVDDTKLALAGELGATHLINAKTQDPLKQVYALTNGLGVDFSVEASGRACTIEQAFQSVHKGGGLCVFATHPPAGDKINLDPFDLICGKQIRGSWGGEAVPDQDIPRFIQFYQKGKMPLEKLITHRFPLEQVNQALDELVQGTVGRALIEMIQR
jgi:S-(hydroxymethyl)glutathione dehydrogenase/alcohol dehydrogenase